MTEQRFILLTTRKLSGEITPEEVEELNSLLTQASYAQRFALLERFWKSKEVVPDVEKALASVLAAIDQGPEAGDAVREEPVPGKMKRAWIVAPLLLLLPVALYFLRQGNEPVQPAPSGKGTAQLPASSILEKQNIKGTRSLITLADGSNVWLNADSKLKYPATFDGNTREVELSGEAFFEVAKNKQKPFIIHLDNGTVKVLGTSFNVKAYKGDRIIETAVVTGKVAFIPRSMKKQDTTFLTPDLKAIYTIETGIVRTISTIGAEDKAWTQGKLIFRNETMADIAAVLERSFGKEVVFNKDEIMSYRLTGSFENNTLEEILYYLSHIKPFTYRITESQVLLYGLE